MSQVIVTEAAAQDLERCRRFLGEKSPEAARRAARIIQGQFMRLKTIPEIGRPLDELPELRELVMAFGDSGYVALYRYVPAEDVVFILAFRHQKEAGY